MHIGNSLNYIPDCTCTTDLDTNICDDMLCILCSCVMNYILNDRYNYIKYDIILYNNVVHS